MNIRKYKDSDRVYVIELLRLNTPHYFSPNEEKDLIYYFDNHADNYYVVEIDDIICGSGGFNISEDGKTAKISWDIIHPERQGVGIGTELLKFRYNEIKKIKGIVTISVRTSQLVYKFYEKFGMELRTEIPDYWDKGFDLYQLDCDIEDFFFN